MVSHRCLYSFLADVDDTDARIIAAESNERAFGREANIGDSNALGTHVHLLDYRSILYLCEGDVVVVFAAGRHDHIVMGPTHSSDLPPRVRISDDSLRHAVV